MKITILCSDYFKHDLCSAVEVFLDYQETLNDGKVSINLERWGVHPLTQNRFYRPLLIIEQNGLFSEKEWAEKDDLYELVGLYAYKEGELADTSFSTT